MYIHETLLAVGSINRRPLFQLLHVAVVILNPPTHVCTDVLFDLVYVWFIFKFEVSTVADPNKQQLRRIRC